MILNILQTKCVTPIYCTSERELELITQKITCIYFILSSETLREIFKSLWVSLANIINFICRLIRFALCLPKCPLANCFLFINQMLYLQIKYSEKFSRFYCVFFLAFGCPESNWCGTRRIFWNRNETLEKDTKTHIFAFDWLVKKAMKVVDY